MHYEIDPDKSHLEEIEVGLYGKGFGQGKDKEEVSWEGALQHQVFTWCLIRQLAILLLRYVSCMQIEYSVSYMHRHTSFEISPQLCIAQVHTFSIRWP